MVDQLFLTGYRPGDMSAIIDLNRLHYADNDPSFPDHFQWKYLDGPAGPAHFGLCWDGGRDDLLVGKISGLPREVKMRDQVIRATLLTDILVHPDYRGHGVAGRIINHLFADCQAGGAAFSYTVPNPLSHDVHSRKIGTPTLGLVPLLIKPFDLRGLRASMLAPLLSERLLSAAQAVYRRSGWVDRGRSVAQGHGLQLCEVDRFGAEFDRFWHRVRDKRALMVRRTADYLEWRFGNVPHRTYLTWAAMDAGEVMGYVVARVMEVFGAKCAMLADLVVDEGDVGWRAGNLLISKVTDYAKSVEVALSGCLMLPGTTEFRLLRRRGYVVCPSWLEPQPFPIIQHAHAPWVQESPASDLGHWFFTMGDYDVV